MSNDTKNTVDRHLAVHAPRMVPPQRGSTLPIDSSITEAVIVDDLMALLAVPPLLAKDTGALVLTAWPSFKELNMVYWTSVSRRHPCEICHKGTWCSRSRDGRVAICQRQGGPGATWRTDKNGSCYWIHFSNDSSDSFHRHVPPLPLAPQPERAATADLDRVYRALLSILPLEAKHRQDLRLRGLSDKIISRSSYRTLPLSGRSRIAGQLVDQLGVDLVSRVPGLVRREGHPGTYWTIAGRPGVIISVRSADGAIIGLMVRCDDPGTGGKYRWLSSKHAGGPSPEMQCHVPLHNGDTRVIRLTEGALKADIATALSGLLTLGLPGVAPWHLALPILQQLQPDMIVLAWDADWRHNLHVAKSLGDCAWALHELGVEVAFEFWQPKLGKGIDDVLVNGHQAERRHWTQALAASARGQARFSGEVSR
jgi:hypothetical protein